MKGYCINLKRSTDRKRKMADQFEREGLDIEFIEAVDGRNLNSHPKIAKGDWANALSHQKIWRDVIDNNRDTSLVFEDQCVLSEGFTDFVSKLKLPERWDMIYLGYTCPRFFGYENDQLDMGKPVGTWCYLVSLEGAKKLVNFDPLDYWMLPDMHLAFLPLRTFYTKNSLASRDSGAQSVTDPNFLRRGGVSWLGVCHFLISVCKQFPILEIIFILLVSILVIRLR